MKKFIVSIILLSFTSMYCTQNFCARNYGGITDFNLPPNTKLLNCSWKDNNLWCLTRSMKPEEVVESYEYIEDSNFGIMHGKVIVKESKK